MNIMTNASPKSFTIGGRTYDAGEINGLIVLSPFVGTAGTFNSMRKPNAGAGGYQITAGKTFKCLGVKIFTTAAGAVSFLYGTTDVGAASASGPTGTVSQFSTTNQPGIMGLANVVTEVGDIGWTVPAGNYPTVYVSSALSVCYVYGIES